MYFDNTIYEMMYNAVVDPSATKEHVDEIERSIRIFKDRIQCIFAIISFEYLHKFLIINIVYL